MLGKIKGRRGKMTEDEMARWHHWLLDMSFSKPQELVMFREAWSATNPWGHNEWDTAEWLNELNWRQASAKSLAISVGSWKQSTGKGSMPKWWVLWTCPTWWEDSEHRCTSLSSSWENFQTCPPLYRSLPLMSKSKDCITFQAKS